MKKILPALVIGAIVLSLAAAGCGGDPAAATVTSFLKALQGGEDSRAASLCYDKYSLSEITGALSGGVRAADVRVVSVSPVEDANVRKSGTPVSPIESVKERVEGPAAEIENRYKPLLAEAEARLGNAKAEMEAAQAQLAYSAETYGRGMPQYYAEQRRIANIQPRIDKAQAEVDTLNAQKQAEIQTLESTAEEQYKSEKAARDKKLAANSIELPSVKVAVELSSAGSKHARTFTVILEDSAWKLYTAK
jgi:ElaB/YqjD/DUF883 family membrane-anchored ribosome-binding protein